MWRQVGTRHWSCLSALTDYVNSHASGLRTHNLVITSHSSQHRRSEPLTSMPWKFHGHSGTSPCGCHNGMPWLCITLSLSTMTCSITWMAWCELWLRRRHNGSNTYTLLRSLCDRSCRNIITKCFQLMVSFSFRQISLIFSRSCDCLGSGTKEWIIIQRTRLFILPNTRRPSGSVWRINTTLNIDVCWSLRPIAYQTTISSSLQRFVDLVNLLMIRMICPAMIKNT